MFSAVAIHFCLTFQRRFGLGFRQTTGLAESLLQLAKLDWAVPDYSTLSVSENIERGHYRTAKECRPAAADQQHRREDAGRR